MTRTFTTSLIAAGFLSLVLSGTVLLTILMGCRKQEATIDPLPQQTLPVPEQVDDGWQTTRLAEVVAQAKVRGAMQSCFLAAGLDKQFLNLLPQEKMLIQFNCGHFTDPKTVDPIFLTNSFILYAVM